MKFLWNDIEDSNNFQNALIREVEICINFEESFRENCIHMYNRLQVIAQWKGSKDIWSQLVKKSKRRVRNVSVDSTDFVFFHFLLLKKFVMILT